MSIMIRAGILLCFLGVIPFLVGLLYTRKKEQDAEGLLNQWVSGYILCFGLFQILTIPCIFLEMSLTFLVILYVSVLAVIALTSLISNRKRILQMMSNYYKERKHLSIMVVFTILVIALQIYIYAAYTHVDDDDAFYVATSLTSVEEDSLYQVNPYTGADYKRFPARYVLSPFPIFVATLSKLSGIHATILAHTFLPIFLLLLAYAVFALTGCELFQKEKNKVACFVFCVAILQMFSSTTPYMQGSFMLLRIWQGKAVLTSVLLPFLFCLGLRCLAQKWEKPDWLLLVAVMLSCSMVSSMGIILGAVMLGILGIVLAILKKDGLLLGKMFLCAIPNLIYTAVYLFVL